MTRRLTPSIYGSFLKTLVGHNRIGELSIFLDYDGTLTPIVGHPDDASLPDVVRETIRALAERYPLVIISGRGIEDLMDKVSVEGLVYVGNHGMEVSSGDFSFVYDVGREERQQIGRVARALSDLSKAFDGAVLEPKGLTLSIHYRLVKAPRVKDFLKALSAVLRPFVRRRLIKVTGGKMIVEIRPTIDWDKGDALGWIMQRRAFSGTVPLCIGDDETDEDAFRVIKGRGVSVFVGKRESCADLYLAKQDEVEPFLSFLLRGG